MYLGAGFVFLQSKLYFKIFCSRKRAVRTFRTWGNNRLFPTYFLFFPLNASQTCFRKFFWLENYYGNIQKQAIIVVMHCKIRCCWNQKSSKATCLWLISWVRERARGVTEKGRFMPWKCSNHHPWIRSCWLMGSKVLWCRWLTGDLVSFSAFCPWLWEGLSIFFAHLTMHLALSGLNQLHTECWWLPCCNYACECCFAFKNRTQNSGQIPSHCVLPP